MTCYQLAPGSEGAKTMNVTAGSTVSYIAKASISHPGPLLAYLAKAPAGKPIESWDGSGKVFFKIYQDEATISPGGMSWPSMGKTFLIVAVLAIRCLLPGVGYDTVFALSLLPGTVSWAENLATPRPWL